MYIDQPNDSQYDLFAERPAFVERVKQELERCPQGIGEYELIQLLQKAGCFSGWISDNPTLALFHKHFAVMHTLYRLREGYAGEGRELVVSPLNIQLMSSCSSTAEGTRVAASAHGVEQFYLDWSHFAEATPETVSDLLKDFWRRYAAADATAVALQSLGLEYDASWEQIQAQYRRLAAEYHPDKGGDSDAFMRIREAYETLKVRYRR